MYESKAFIERKDNMRNENILRAPRELISRMEKASESAEYRNDFMRDRDRIMYCSAFRRLDGKTQIYLTGKNDHRRNRLTHTLEVAQIARTISQALDLDVDLTEAIALGHDLGHTPFGHAGEQILNEIMQPESEMKILQSPFYKNDIEKDKKEKPIFGFKHNIQSVRVAAVLENGYGNAGLNLTNYTLWGMMHHSKLQYKNPKNLNYYKEFDKNISVKNGGEAWSFESFVVAQADEIAQWHHDLEDALRSGALSPKRINQIIEEILATIMSDPDKDLLLLMKDCSEKDNYDEKKFVTLASKVVVNTLVTHIVKCSKQNLLYLIKEKNIGEINREEFFQGTKWEDDFIKEAIGFDLCGKSDNMKKKLKSFPEAIKTEIHHSPEVERMNAKGQYIIRKLFQAYYSHPQQLPDISIARFMIATREKNDCTGGHYIDMDSIYKMSFGQIRSEFEEFWKNVEKSKKFYVKTCMMRTICDHIASMTDHYAIEEYEKLYG